MYNNDSNIHQIIDEINNAIDRQIEVEKRKIYEYHNRRVEVFDLYDEDGFHRKIDMLESQRRRMIEKILNEAYHQQPPTIKSSKDIVKDKIADAIDKFYEKEGLSKNEEVDIIVRKVGNTYVATVDKRRDQKIKEILDD